MTTITFKLPEEEAEDLRAQARSRHLSVSEYIRRTLSAPPQKRKKRVIGRHPVSGAICELTPGKTVTDAEVKAILADFP